MTRWAVIAIAALPALGAAAPVRLTIRTHDGIVPDLAFAGDYVALAAQREGVRLFDATTREPRPDHRRARAHPCHRTGRPDHVDDRARPLTAAR